MLSKVYQGPQSPVRTWVGRLGLIFVPIMLAGCLGSAVIEGEDVSDKKFPSLQSVPDRPPATLRSPEALQQDRESLEQDYHESLLKTRRLRQGHPSQK